MTLRLDDRQRRMLEEFGIRLFDVPVGWEREVDQATASGSGAANWGQSPISRDASSSEEDSQGNWDPTPIGSVPALQREPAPIGSAPALEGRDGIDLLSWDELAQAVAGCRACKLCDGRRNTVFGVGPRQADWLVVGEAPGENEDLQGEPFVGQAGKLLDNMLAALSLNRRDSVYIANVLKCRPPGNRNPEPDEVAQCEPFLRRQVALLQPKIILAMGRFAVQALLQTTEPIGKLRGRVHRYEGVPVVVTYHPAYLLRNLPDKAKAWADLCLARSLVTQ